MDASRTSDFFIFSHLLTWCGSASPTGLATNTAPQSKPHQSPNHSSTFLGRTRARNPRCRSGRPTPPCITVRKALRSVVRCARYSIGEMILRQLNTSPPFFRLTPTSAQRTISPSFPHLHASAVHDYPVTKNMKYKTISTSNNYWLLSFGTARGFLTTTMKPTPFWQRIDMFNGKLFHVLS